MTEQDRLYRRFLAEVGKASSATFDVETLSNDLLVAMNHGTPTLRLVRRFLTASARAHRATERAEYVAIEWYKSQKASTRKVKP